LAIEIASSFLVVMMGSLLWYTVIDNRGAGRLVASPPRGDSGYMVIRIRISEPVASIMKLRASVLAM